MFARPVASDAFFKASSICFTSLAFSVWSEATWLRRSVMVLPNSTFFAFRASSLVNAALYFFWETQEVKRSAHIKMHMRLCLFIRQLCCKSAENYAISKFFAQKTMHINFEFKARSNNIETIELKPVSY